MTTDRQHCHRSLPSGWADGRLGAVLGRKKAVVAEVWAILAGLTLTHIRHVTDKLWQLDECRHTSSNMPLANIMQFCFSYEIIFHFHFLFFFPLFVCLFSWCGFMVRRL